jgi:hypothetical protein
MQRCVCKLQQHGYSCPCSLQRVLHLCIWFANPSVLSVILARRKLFYLFTFDAQYLRLTKTQLQRHQAYAERILCSSHLSMLAQTASIREQQRTVQSNAKANKCGHESSASSQPSINFHRASAWLLLSCCSCLGYGTHWFWLPMHSRPTAAQDGWHLAMGTLPKAEGAIKSSAPTRDIHVLCLPGSIERSC